jgi:HlyD family secretion protein
MQTIPIRRPVPRVAEAGSPADAGAGQRSRMSMGWLLVAVAGLAVGAASVDVVRRLTRAPDRTDHVTRGAVVGVLRAEGRLQVLRSARIGSFSPGQVVAVEVDVGDSVTRGQIMARLDDLEQRAAVTDARAAVETAQIRRARAEKHVIEELSALDDEGWSAGDAAPGDLLTGTAGEAQLDLMTAQSQLERASSRRALARAVLARRNIRAPIDGVVLARSIDPGETITSSPPGPPLFVVGSDPSHLRLEIELDDEYAARVHPGPVAVVADALPGRSFVAEIREIRPASAVSMSASRYRISMDVENVDGLLRPGMSASVSVPMESAPNALRVPVAALAPTALHGSSRTAVLWVLDANGKPSAVTVETGIMNDRLAEIRAGGLRRGDTVTLP